MSLRLSCEVGATAPNYAPGAKRTLDRRHPAQQTALLVLGCKRCQQLEPEIRPFGGTWAGAALLGTTAATGQQDRWKSTDPVPGPPRVWSRHLRYGQRRSHFQYRDGAAMYSSGATNAIYAPASHDEALGSILGSLKPFASPTVMPPSARYSGDAQNSYQFCQRNRKPGPSSRRRGRPRDASLQAAPGVSNTEAPPGGGVNNH